MTLRWGLYLAILAAPALRADTILDVSANTGTTVQTGNILTFQVISGSFSRNALAFGQSVYPTDISFALVTAPISGAGDFQAALQSADGSVSIAFGGPLTFTDGVLQSSGYSGAVSTLNGYLHLSPPLSEALFSSSPVLTLTNDGPDVTLGLDPYTLRQELHVSLGSGPLTVGALQGSVTLESQSLQSSLNLGGPVGIGTDSQVPEPNSAGLLLGGGTLLVAVSLLMRRLAARGDSRIACEKSTVCNP